jgi:hypothetical protein
LEYVGCLLACVCHLELKLLQGHIHTIIFICGACGAAELLLLLLLLL